MMGFSIAYEAVIRQETQVGIMICQVRKGVEGDAVHRYKSGGGEHRLLEEQNSMEAMVIRHGLLNYPTPL
jgi:hypothetical protein